MRSEYERWLDKVERIPWSGCWIWMGTTYRGGYGHFRRKWQGKWKMYKAHRFSYEYYNGQIPTGFLVRHTCDTTCCVNPDHLVIGTTQDNTDDRMSRGRHNGGKKLSGEAVRLIRLAWQLTPKKRGMMTKYAKHWDISVAQMSRILSNKSRSVE